MRPSMLVSIGRTVRSKLFSTSFFSSPKMGRKSWFASATCLSVLCFCSVDLSSTESAIANGDTRTIRLYHSHTGETIEATYRVNGHYDPAVLEKLNWFLRDWRRAEATKMDPRLFDAVWESYRGAGATEPITVLCGFRSPETNSMLRARSRGVAEHSQHILGKAMDTTMPGLSMEKVREVAMRLQLGGVGYYGNTNFVHIDVGGVRSWPRMSYDQLSRLFPDGKTVHIAANGQPLAHYEEARAEIQARGGGVDLPSSQGPNFFAWLFGLGHGEDEREETATASTAVAARTVVPIRAASRSRTTEDAPPVQTAEKADKTPDKTVVAALAPARNARSFTALDTSADTDKAFQAALPLPPSRPVELASLAADVPLPPIRPSITSAIAPAVVTASVMPAAVPTPPVPTALPTAPRPVEAAQKKDAIGGLIATTNAAAPLRTASLPDLITRGSNTPAAAPTAVLAYAAAAPMEGLRTAARNKKAEGPVHVATATQAPAPMMPARLDRSNFLVMTGSVEAARLSTQTVLGPTVAGLRQVAQNQLRIQAGSLSNVALVASPSRFAVASADLPTDHFSDTTSRTAYALASPADRAHVIVGALALKNGE
jgi:uncharacterized protein YcbK (DUF882 family)